MKFGSAIIQQVVTGYETLGLSVGDISDQLNLKIDAVEYILLTNSVTYKEQTRAEGSAPNTDNGNSSAKENPGPSESGTLSVLLKEYEVLARYSDDDHVREKALRNLINEHKGRNDIPAKSLALKERMLARESSQEERLKKFNLLIINAGAVPISGSVIKGIAALEDDSKDKDAINV